jgi:hypothetical protein
MHRHRNSSLPSRSNEIDVAMAWQDEQNSGVQNSSFSAVNKLEYHDASGASRRQAIQRTGVAAAQSDCWNRPAPCPQWGQRAGRKMSLILGRRPPLLTRSSPSAQAACRLSRFQCAGTPHQSQDWCRHHCSEIGINPGFFRIMADLFVRRAVVRTGHPNGVWKRCGGAKVFFTPARGKERAQPDDGRHRRELRIRTNARAIDCTSAFGVGRAADVARRRTCSGGTRGEDPHRPPKTYKDKTE